MAYLAIARKWRPQRFEDIVGQGHVTRTLQNAIQLGRIHHAFLFTGARGVGKTTAARILARCLNCEKGPTGTPCNVCRNCKEITVGISGDVQEIDAASNTGVESIRELRDNVRYLPASSKYKIYIVDEVHMLSVAAFNALLKTLEEPPSHVAFIFATTDPQKVPDTILSRCQRFDFKRIPLKLIAEKLLEISSKEGVQISEASLLMIAREADGSMRDAQSLLDQVIASAGASLTDEEVVEILGLIDRRLIYECITALLEQRPERALAGVDHVYGFGFDMKIFARELLEVVRNLNVVKVSNQVERFVDVSAEELQLLRDLAAKTPQDVLSRLFKLMLEGYDQVARSEAPRLSLELTLLRMAQVKPMQPLDELISKLSILEAAIKAGKLPSGGSGGAGGGAGGAPSGGAGGSNPSGGAGGFSRGGFGGNRMAEAEAAQGGAANLSPLAPVGQPSVSGSNVGGPPPGGPPPGGPPPGGSPPGGSPPGGPPLAAALAQSRLGGGPAVNPFRPELASTSSSPLGSRTRDSEAGIGARGLPAVTGTGSSSAGAGGFLPGTPSGAVGAGAQGSTGSIQSGGAGASTSAPNAARPSGFKAPVWGPKPGGEAARPAGLPARDGQAEHPDASAPEEPAETFEGAGPSNLPVKVGTTAVVSRSASVVTMTLKDLADARTEAQARARGPWIDLMVHWMAQPPGRVTPNYLKHGCPVKEEHERVILGFSKQLTFSKAELESKDPDIQAQVNAYFGRPVRIECRLLSEQDVAAPSYLDWAEATERLRRSEVIRKELDDVRLKAAQKLFGASQDELRWEFERKRG